LALPARTPVLRVETRRAIPYGENGFSKELSFTRTTNQEITAMFMKRFPQNTFAAAVALLALFLQTGCNKPASDSGGAETIKIGEFASLNGSEASFGRSSHNGTLLAVEQINAAGGVLGKKLDLIYEDDQSKDGESATAVKKLISRDKVVAILGEVASGRSLEAAPICQQFKIPQISPSSTNPKVTQMGDYIFRVCWEDKFQGSTVLAKFALNGLKAKRVALLTDVGAPYSVGLANYFKEGFVAGGGDIIVEQKFTKDDKDFKAQLTAIKSLNPDAIFIPAYYGQVTLIALQARELGISVPLFGGDGWEAPELIQGAGVAEALEGCFFSTHFSVEQDSPKAKQFVADYEKRFGAIPDAMGALGYDSVLALVDAIKRANSTDSTKIRVTGKTTLDADRNARKPAVIIEIKGGKFVYKETVNP
jgi:branched-chain amino acid transport system substrate-binding protein